MKTALHLGIFLSLIASGSAYSGEPSGKCGGMEKLGPPAFDGISLTRSRCNYVSTEQVTKPGFGPAPYRSITFFYELPANGRADIMIGDMRKNLADPGLAMVRTMIQSTKSQRKAIESTVKAGIAGEAKVLKDFDEGARVMNLLTAEDSVVSYSDGDGSLMAVVSGNISVLTHFPAKNMDDAIRVSKQLFTSINFNLINSSAIDPL